MKLSIKDTFEFLEEKQSEYNQPSFIESDPISIPHFFSKKEDIEISAFLTATIAWGRRSMIINNAKKLAEYMDYSPYDFIINFTEHDLKSFENFKHRTFNGQDCTFFLWSLKNIYNKYKDLESCFSTESDSNDPVFESIINFRNIFFSISYPERTLRHVSNPATNSAAKRLNMFLRWMVRKDNKGVDFGIWNNLKMKDLLCPLDIHSGNVARKLGLLKRKQNDWKAVHELTNILRKFDPSDPVKYDFALFGLGVFEKF